MIATARTCNLILIVLDCMKPITHKRLIEKELEVGRGRAGGVCVPVRVGGRAMCVLAGRVGLACRAGCR